MDEFDDRTNSIVLAQQRDGVALRPVLQEVKDALLPAVDTAGSAALLDEARLIAKPSLVEQLVAQAQCPHPIWHPLRFGGWALSMGFGIVTMVFALAIVASIPIVNFIALGYLLDVEGRVARSGKFREAFPLLPLAPRIGSLVIGIWLCLLPLYFTR